VVDEPGSLRYPTPLEAAGQDAVLVAALPAPGPPGGYLKLGDWPGLVSGAVVALGALAALTRRARAA